MISDIVGRPRLLTPLSSGPVFTKLLNLSFPSYSKFANSKTGYQYNFLNLVADILQNNKLLYLVKEKKNILENITHTRN